MSDWNCKVQIHDPKKVGDKPITFDLNIKAQEIQTALTDVKHRMTTTIRHELNWHVVSLKEITNE